LLIYYFNPLFINHNHEQQSELLINRQTISSELKRKAIDDNPVESPSKSIHTDLRENDTDM